MGHAVLEDLDQHGYRVTNIDSIQHGSIQTIKADINDFANVMSSAKAVDAIAHLAAIPSPFGFSPHVVFENNVLTTFNVLQAASDLGIKTVVIASSLATLGLAFKTHEFTLTYHSQG